MAKAEKFCLRDDPYFEMLKKCRLLVEKERAIFVLSNIHHIELQKIGNPRQRGDIALIMRDLSNYSSILNRSIASKHELDSAIAAKINLTCQEIPTPFIGKGYFHSTGNPMRLTFVDARTGLDQTTQAIAEMGEEKFDTFVKFANEYTEEKFLFGPADNDLDVLRTLGYAQEKMDTIYEGRCQVESDLASRLRNDPKWRKGNQLSRVVAAHEVIHELGYQLIHALSRHKVSLETILGQSSEEAQEFVFALPSTSVTVAIRTHYHSQINKKWKVNDVHDIDAMSVAVPYCDAVMSDKEIENALLRGGIDLRMNTRIGSNPTQFLKWNF